MTMENFIGVAVLVVVGIVGGIIVDKEEQRAAERKKFQDGWNAPEKPYCVFCKTEHEGGDTCMGHYP